MHIAMSNFYLPSVTGPKMPADIKSADMEKTVTGKAGIIGWLKRSLDAVRSARGPEARRSPAQSQDLRRNCHRGWHVSPNHDP